MRRDEILAVASEKTMHARNESYGDPTINLGCHGQLLDIAQRHARNNSRLSTLPPLERAAIEAALAMVLGKVARILCGDPLHEDNYVDGAAYFAIAGEAADLASTIQRERAERARSIATPGKSNAFGDLPPGGFADELRAR